MNRSKGRAHLAFARSTPDMRERIRLAAGWRRFLELVERQRREREGEPTVRLER